MRSKYGLTKFHITKEYDEGLTKLVELTHNYCVDVIARELYLHGDPENMTEDAEPGVDYRMATTFVKNLNTLNNISHKNILIHQHTSGGYWNDGMAIYNALQFSGSSTTMVAYSHSRSMSSITIQAADCRVLMPDTEFMVHHGTFGINDRLEAVQAAAKQNERLMDRMLNIYAFRCRHGKYFKGKKMNMKDIKAYIDNRMRVDADWWMLPDEALDFGFVDGIMGEKGFKDFNSIRSPKRKRCTG